MSDTDERGAARAAAIEENLRRSAVIGLGEGGPVLTERATWRS